MKYFNISNKREKHKSLKKIQKEENNKVKAIEEDNFQRLVRAELRKIKATKEYKNDLGIKQTLKDMSVIAFPSMIFSFTEAIFEIIDLAFISQKYKNSKYTEAIGISYLIYNCTLLYLYTSILSGTENLCSNALSLKQYTLMGYYFQRARIIAYFVVVVVVTFHIFTLDYTLKLLNPDPDVVAYSKEFMKYLLLFSFIDVQGKSMYKLFGIFELGKVYLFFICIACVLHPFWCYLFIYKLDYGVSGAGISYIISMSTNILCCTVYLWIYHPYPEANFWINRNCFNLQGIIQYLKFSIGVSALEWGELFSYEIQALVPLMMKEPNYAVFIIFANCIALLYTAPLGITQSNIIILSDLLPSRKISTVKKYFYVSLFFSAIFEMLVCLVFYIFSDKFVMLFTEDKTQLKIAFNVLTIMPFVSFIDGMQTLLMSFLKGLGKQYLAISFMIIVMYFANPLGKYIGGIYLNYELYGMYIGDLFSLTFAVILYSSVICCVSLDKAQYTAVERLVKDNLLLNRSNINNNSNNNIKISYEININGIQTPFLSNNDRNI